MKKRELNKNKLILLMLFILLITVIGMIMKISGKMKEESSIAETTIKNEISGKVAKTNSDLNWKLMLVNPDNKLPNNYSITLEDIDEYRAFDSRAIKYLKTMIDDMRRQQVGSIWVQSSYRSVEEQNKLYNNKVQYYKNKGKTTEEAKRLTEEVISKPGYSEHNLGLAVDFNYVNNSFENTKEFKWLKENAEDYGFILRYPKEKESITKMSYEPWHWRYVGEENAKKIKELGFCLEEYIDYIN